MENPKFDYENQAWTAFDRATNRQVYIRCGHPETMDCRCYGREHVGEIANLTDER
jgi:hypothetical protein